MRARITMLLWVATALTLVLGAGARAATVTVGSPLTVDFGGTFGSAPSGTWSTPSSQRPARTSRRR
jgi:hypothetical protein